MDALYHPITSGTTAPFFYLLSDVSIPNVFGFIPGNNSSRNSSELRLQHDLREASGSCSGTGGNSGSSEVYF